MSHCHNCGKANAPESQFCRFCGMRLAQPQQPQVQTYGAPRPYAWKTDEFQTQNEARAPRTSDHVIIPNQQMTPAHFYAQQSLSYRGPKDFSGNYRCPNCGTNFLPIVERRVSPAGWVTFSLLLVFTLVFFWIGLLIKEDVPFCPICKQRLN